MCLRTVLGRPHHARRIKPIFTAWLKLCVFVQEEQIHSGVARLVHYRQDQQGRERTSP